MTMSTSVVTVDHADTAALQSRSPCRGKSPSGAKRNRQILSGECVALILE